jgi:alpha-beta hydrolase superfamily lysophospholipase
MSTTFPEAIRPSVAALHAAMPYTRLTDCGMNPADARSLLAATAAGGPWAVVAGELADARAASADAAFHAGRRLTALESARWAAGAALIAQMAGNEDTEHKRELYRRYVQRVSRVAELSDPALERVELPWRDGRLVGWLALPASGRAAATVVVWGGLSSWGAAYLGTADALNARGLACLLAEGPGQGEPRLLSRLHMDEHVTDGFARFVDAIEADPRLGDAIGVQGNSFGGLFAGLLAAADPRVGACLINGSPSAPTVPESRSACEQLFAALGSADRDHATAVLNQLGFDGRRTPIASPLLVLHGDKDPLVNLAEQQRFLEGGDPATSRLAVWRDGEHTLYNYAAERNSLTADWFVDQLVPPAE